LSKGAIKTSTWLNGVPYRPAGRWHLHITKLKKNTWYRIFHENEDVSTQCRTIHGVGTERTGRTAFKSDSRGRIYFVYFYKQGVTPSSVGDKGMLSFLTKGTPTNDNLYLVPESAILAAQVPVTNSGIVTSKSPAVTSAGKPVPHVCHAVVNNPINYPVYVFQNIEYDFIQTFYVDPNAVNLAKTVNLLNVQLYFKTKPNRTNNTSGLTDPGVTVHLIDVESGKPITDKSYSDSHVNRDYGEVYTSTDASVGTTFNFINPIEVETGRQYGIAVILEDDDYQLWYAKAGDKQIGSSDASNGPRKNHKGELFQRTNSGESLQDTTKEAVFKAMLDTDLKFDVQVAKYTSNTITYELVNEDYEFLNVSNVNNTFYAGEFVYQETANAAGTIDITGGTNVLYGTNTDFIAGVANTPNSAIISDGDYIVLTDGTPGNTEVVLIDTIVSDTEILLVENFPFDISNGAYIIAPIATLHYHDTLTDNMVLDDSNATLAKTFAANGTLIGIESTANCYIDSVEDFPISTFVTDIKYNTPALTVATAKYNFTNATYTTSTANTDLDLNMPNHLDGFESVIMSRSNEVLNTTNLFDNDKSVVIHMTFDHRASNTNLFESPTLKGNALNLCTSTWEINNDTTDEYLTSGNAHTKHISTKLTFEDDRYAEDIKVITNAYRPPNTDVKIFAKIYNDKDPESFDDKEWTELELTGGIGKYSTAGNRNDIVEYTYGFPLYPPSNTTLTGVCNTTLSNSTVYGTGTTWDTDLANNDIIKIYSSLFPNNYVIASITEVVSNTEITLSSPINNNNVVDTGLKIDTLATSHTAFNNNLNDNIVRYFNKAGTKFDTYNSVAIKTVLLADQYSLVPQVDDTRIIGVSA
jgi:hypothetical protein